MLLDRRSFLKTAGLGAAALAAGKLALAKPAVRPMKNWIWIPNGIQKSSDEWKLHFAHLRDSGISAILPEIYDGKHAYFESARLPVKRNWLGEILPLARAEGLEVHAWMWSMPCLVPEIMKAHPDWYSVNAKGESAVDKPAYVPYYRFLDPGRPEVREWVQGTVKELAGIPELTGVHLDYIRHPDVILTKPLQQHYGVVQDKVYPQYDYGYSPYEREQFKKQYGADPLEIKDEKLAAAWLQFRFDMVTGLVNGYLVPAARAKGKQITAAVFPGPKMARETVRQDWGKWHLDAFLPMLYHSLYGFGPEWIEQQTREGVSTVEQPIYSGVAPAGWRGDDGDLLEGDAFRALIDAALNGGASGVSLFCDGEVAESNWALLKQITAARNEAAKRGA
jgi:uncharacterized lipoprotein YddW (UPF0748 family)